MHFPSPLAGAKRFYAWLNLLLRACIASKIVESSDIMPTRTSAGTKLALKSGAGGGGQYHDFKLCRNGQTITCRIDSRDDPATVEEDE